MLSSSLQHCFIAVQVQFTLIQPTKPPASMKRRGI